MTAMKRQLLETNVTSIRMSVTGMRRTACVLIAVLFGCLATSAQNQRSASMPSSERSSDLGRDNLSRVAASAADLQIVLLRDAGLLVELRRWIAKDATDHGQVVGDPDLTNDAIFERLEADSQFRAVATLLVQRYGYLLPKVNPDSELGKEREFLILERTKWLAQNQEEELAAARQRNQRNLQNARACDPQFDQDCNASQSNRPTNGAQEQLPQPGTGMPPQQNFPNQQSPPTAPRPGENPLERAQLTQTSEQPSDLYSALQLGDRSQTPGAFNGLSLNSDANQLPGSIQQPLGTSDTEEQFGIGLTVGTAANQRDGAAAYGANLEAASGTIPSSSGASAREMNQYIPPGMSLVVPVQASTRRYQQNALLQPVELARKPSPYTDIPSLYDMYIQAVTRPTTP